ncbi:MAG TPA: hypothetical protein VIL07_10620 [Symbiobacteriaceae bacterium]
MLLILCTAAAALWDGLYSPEQQLVAVAVLATAVVAMGTDARMTGWEWAGALLVLLGSVLSLSKPAGWGTAAHGPVLAAGWLLALLLARRMAGRIEAALGQALAVTGAVMLFAGLAAISYLPLHHSGRLASFLGYPNAVGILGLMGLAGALPGGQQGRWWSAPLLYGNALAVFLSGSRGVWGAAVLLAGFLAWAAPALLRRAAVPAAWALAAALWVGPAVAEGRQGAALAAALAGLVVAVAWDRLGEGLRRWRAWMLLPAALWLTAAALAPGWGWLLSRAGALPLTEGSSVERWILLRDGLSLARTLPLGAGLRAWAALHLQRASYGYYAAHVHSAPLELAIDFGWAGAAGFLLLLGRFLLGLRKARDWDPERTALLGGLGALGVHALLDWDLTYGFFMLLIWAGFGLMEGSRPRGPIWPAQALATGALLGALLLGAGDVLTEWADRSLAAGDVRSAWQHASAAVAINPWNDRSHGAAGQALAALGRSDEAVLALQQARRLAPYEPWYAQLEARELRAAGRVREAARAYRDLVALWPWHVPAYETALQVHVTMLLEAEWRGDAGLVDAIMQSGRAILAQLDRQKASEPPNMPRAPMAVDTPVIQQARAVFGEGTHDS